MSLDVTTLARAISVYQSPYEDGVIMGTPQAYKPLTLDILNNNKYRIIGVVKAKIKQIK